VVAGGGDRGAVPAVRDEHHVTRADLGQHVDGPVRGTVNPLVGEPLGFEVVDLLEFGLVRALLIVLVRRVGGPVAARREHLDRDQLVAVERLGPAEIVDLPAGLACAAQFDRDVLGGPVARRQFVAAPGRGQGEGAAGGGGGHGDGGVARGVGEVADPVEDVAPALELERLAVAGHRGRAGQRQDEQLVLAAGPGVRPAGRQFEHPQAAVGPAGPLGRQHEGKGAAAGGAGRQVQLVVHSLTPSSGRRRRRPRRPRRRRAGRAASGPPPARIPTESAGPGATGRRPRPGPR
jgi:hypothetical protein